MAHEVTIRIRAFPYYEDAEDPVTGRTVRREQIAVRGQTVELSDEDFRRAEKFDAIVKDEEPSSDLGTDEQRSDAVEAGEITVEEASVEDLSAWLRHERPTVDEVVAKADDDPVAARKLLDAENHATGGEPRSTLVERLQSVIDEA